MTEETTFDFGPFLTNPFGENYLYSLNRNTFAEIHSDEIYRSFYGADFFEENSLYLIAGTDGGLLLNYLSRVELPRGCRVVLVELQEMIQRLKEVVTLDKLPSNVILTTYHEMNSRLEEVRINDYLYSERAKILKSLCVTDALSDAYQELFDNVRASFEEAIGVTRNNFEGRMYTIRQIQNLAENRVPANYLQDAFQGKTCILLAVGPSLDKVIPWVIENRERLIVLAVSRTAKRLTEVGIIPDIFFSIDPTDYSFDVSREMLNYWKNCLFIAGNHICPALHGSWSGRSAYLGRLFPWPTPLEPANMTSAGPTITQTAIAAAITMGFSRILLGGVDLCFSPEGHVYGASTQGREKGPRVGTIKGGVETNSGDRAETILAFSTAASITEKLADVGASRGCKLINLSAGAVKMRGIQYLPAEEVVLSDNHESPLTLIEKALPADGSKERLEHYTRVSQELTRVAKDLKSIMKLAKEGIAANKGLFGRDGKAAEFHHKKKMDKVEATLQTRYADLSQLLKKFGIMLFLKVIRPDWEDWTDEEVERTGTVYYEAYYKSAERFLELVTNSLQKLKVRQMEEGRGFNMKRMTEQWRSDQQFGRAQVWQNWHPEKMATINSAEKALWAEIDDKFQALMRREEHLSKSSEATPLDVKETRGRARRLFQRKDSRVLKILTAGVEEKLGDSGAEPCYWLLQGYLAELSANVDEAFSWYGRIVEQGESEVMEDALARIATLSAESSDMEHLQLALQCLAGLSPVYLPKYGDLLWMLGDHASALDQYASYLEIVPHDTAAWLKLGTYYVKLGVSEGATMALEHVLETEPDNQTAKKLLEELG